MESLPIQYFMLIFFVYLPCIYYEKACICGILLQIFNFFEKLLFFALFENFLEAFYDLRGFFDKSGYRTDIIGRFGGI